MSKNTKPQTPKSLLAVLVAASQADKTDADTGRPGVTAQDAGTDAIRMGRLADLDLVKVSGTRRHRDEQGNVKRGRPMNLYTLTSKGRGRAKRAQA